MVFRTQKYSHGSLFMAETREIGSEQKQDNYVNIIWNSYYKYELYNLKVLHVENILSLILGAVRKPRRERNSGTNQNSIVQVMHDLNGEKGGETIYP